MARCPGCNKFATNDEAEPEVSDLEVDAGNGASCSVRIMNASERRRAWQRRRRNGSQQS